MEFRTKVIVEPSARPLNHARDRILLLGSCFTDAVGARLRRDGFNVCVNPFGPLFNPDSVLKALKYIVNSEKPDVKLGFPDVEAVKFPFTRLIVTLGTARVFCQKSDGVIVANCRRRPQSEFIQRRLTVDEAVQTLRGILDIAPGTLFTVSPMRHPDGDGLHGNSLNKAVLLLAVDGVGAEYFPAYEALLDDLRDYRFTSADMRHPTDVAVDYIYDLFSKAYFNPEDKARIEACRAFSMLKAHRPADADKHARLVEEARQKLITEYGIFPETYC